MAIETITWQKNKIKLIDQTKLPLEFKYIYCKDIEALYQAIKELRVRGAPALGIAASLGVYLGIRKLNTNSYSTFISQLNKVIKYLGSSRPTAVNLFWAMDRLKNMACNNKNKTVKEIKALLLKEAFRIIEEDRKTTRRMADFGARLIKNGDSILTVCNAGALATADYGTALGVIYRAKEQGKRIKVYASETRPLLQGARLTMWELQHEKIDATLVCDNMAASLMQNRKIDKVFVGADRIANNGDTANKIGTYNLAVLANFHKIPFYVVAPISTFDFSIATGRHIPIEQRAAKEVTQLFFKKRIAPYNIKVYNPAFDITPSKLINAIITEKAILRRPFRNLHKKIGTFL